jgi:hypothetical protein
MHDGVPRLPYRWRMRRKAHSCSTLALWAYDGTRVRGGTRSQLTVSEMRAELGQDVRVVRRSALPQYSAMFGNTNDRRHAFLVYLRKECDKIRADLPSALTDVKGLPEEVWTKRMVLCLWDDYLYPGGHAVVIWPPRDDMKLRERRAAGKNDRWALRDPWRVSGTAVALNRRQLAMLLLGCEYILL